MAKQLAANLEVIVSKPNIKLGQTVHYHTPWKHPIETDVYHAELDADDFSVILPNLDQQDWKCGVTDGSLCVEDICQNRESTETYVLIEGYKAVALDLANQAMCDQWAELHADCWQ